MPRYASSTDDNQAEIVKALRKLGCSVAISSGVGEGYPDLAVGFLGCNIFMEVKDSRKPPSKRKLTPDQQIWHDNWKGQVNVVESAEQAIALVYRLTECWRAV